MFNNHVRQLKAASQINSLINMPNLKVHNQISQIHDQINSIMITHGRIKIHHVNFKADQRLQEQSIEAKIILPSE